MPRLVSLERSLDAMQAWAASIPQIMEPMANLQTYLVLDMAIGRGAHTVTSSVKHMPVLSAHQQLLVASLIQEGEAKAQTLLDSLFRRAPSIYNYTPFALALVVRAQKITGPHQPGDWNIKVMLPRLKSGASWVCV